MPSLFYSLHTLIALPGAIRIAAASPSLLVSLWIERALVPSLRSVPFLCCEVPSLDGQAQALEHEVRAKPTFQIAIRAHLHTTQPRKERVHTPQLASHTLLYSSVSLTSNIQLTLLAYEIHFESWLERVQLAGACISRDRGER